MCLECVHENKVVEEVERILNANNIRYRLEAPLPDRQRIDIFLLDANIGLECKGQNTKSFPHKFNHTVKQIKRYKKYLKEVWLILPTDASARKYKKISDNTLSVYQFKNEIPTIIKQIEEY